MKNTKTVISFLVNNCEIIRIGLVLLVELISPSSLAQILAFSLLPATLQQQLFQHFVLSYQQFHSGLHILYLGHVVVMNFVVYAGTPRLGFNYGNV